MKELSIKEKAEAYDYAVNKAKELILNENGVVRVDKPLFDELFPSEMEETEDEKIRKGLIDFVNQYGDNFYGQISKGYAIAWLEKQGEQKPVWSEEEKKKLDRIYYILGIAADEHAYSNTCRLIGDKEAIELQDFLRSIAKPEQKSDWSEEDEERIKNILSVLGVQVCWDGATGEKNNPYQKEINWLKSLRPQSTWKPSEEHIHGLIWVINRMPDFKKANEAEAVLRDLLEQLNKLRKG